MRRFILTTAVIFLVFFTVNANSIDREVSNFSKEQFASDFNNTSDATWKRTALFDEVNFIQDGKKYTAFYDDQSQLVGTTSVIEFASLPQNAQQEIKKNFKDYSVESIISYNDNELNATNIQLFGFQTEAADSYFVELKKDDKHILLQVFISGDVTFFQDLK